LTTREACGETPAVRYFFAAFLLTSLSMAALLYGLFAHVGDNLPSPHSQQDIEPSVATRILDRNGGVIDELFVEDRVPLTMAEIPTSFVQAIIAVEDRRFYSHWGVDPLGVARAAKADLLRGSTTQGASTITQQLARNLFLHHRRTWKRKVLEAILALRLERGFEKDEILEFYTNQIYFGEGAYGLEAASRRFCGVPASELTVDQAAMLAGLVGNPAAFSPRRHPENCRRRRDHVLRAMRSTAALDEAAYEYYRSRPLRLKESSPESQCGAYYTEMVRQRLGQRFGSSEIYHNGLTVESTLDPALQRAAEDIVETHLRSLEMRNDYPYLHGLADSMLAPLGFPLQDQLPAPLRLQAAVVAIEPATGAIRVLVGGRDFHESEFNRAVQAPRQPASAFKTFVFAEAIREGYRTTDILLDAPVEYEIPGAEDEEAVWAVENFSESYHGPVTLRYALMKSINVPTAKLLAAITPRPVIRLAHRLGVRSPLPEVLSLATGTGELTLLEMTAAYAVFANQGILVEPYLIDRIFDRYGHLVHAHELHSEQVLDERTSFIVTSMLQSVMEGGTGKTARSLWGFRHPAAGKTGTYDDYTDAWFIGYTPDLVVGVWVGFDLKIPIGDKHTGTGAMAALPIWAQLMKAATEGRAPRDFDMPDGLVRARTCLDSGLLASPDCPDVVEDVFVPGTEPQETCRMHRGIAEPGGEFEDLDRQLLRRERWDRDAAMLR